MYMHEDLGYHGYQIIHACMDTKDCPDLPVDHLTACLLHSGTAAAKLTFFLLPMAMATGKDLLGSLLSTSSKGHNLDQTNSIGQPCHACLRYML